MLAAKVRKTNGLNPGARGCARDIVRARAAIGLKTRRQARGAAQAGGMDYFLGITHLPDSSSVGRPLEVVMTISAVVNCGSGV